MGFVTDVLLAIGPHNSCQPPSTDFFRLLHANWPRIGPGLPAPQQGALACQRHLRVWMGEASHPCLASSPQHSTTQKQSLQTAVRVNPARPASPKRGATRLAAPLTRKHPSFFIVPGSLSQDSPVCPIPRPRLLSEAGPPWLDNCMPLVCQVCSRLLFTRYAFCCARCWPSYKTRFSSSSGIHISPDSPDLEEGETKKISRRVANGWQWWTGKRIP